MKIVFFTGAGISQESGIPTFRDDDGLWKEFDIDLVCSKRGYQKDRGKVLDFHNKLRQQIDMCKPNLAHIAIAEIERDHNVTVVTQNIDNLHEKAGSSDIIKIHGDLYTARLKRYKNPTIAWDQDILPDSFPDTWERCKGSMRHNTVLFGEKVHKLKKAKKAIDRADLLIVVGTSLSVYPATDLIKDTSTYKVMINNGFTECDHLFDFIIHDKATKGIPKYLQKIRDGNI